MIDYAVLFAIVLAINLLPAFGPPTWSVIVLYGLNTDLPVAGIVPTAAAAAALGRFLLAWAFRLLRNKASARTRHNLAAARELFERKKKNAILALGLFALSPLPSAQLFEAAGLAGVRLVGFTLAFFAGRLASYSLYAATAKGIREYTLGDAFEQALTSPVGLAIQLAMIAGLVALTRIDWAKRLARAPDEVASSSETEPCRDQ